MAKRPLEVVHSKPYPRLSESLTGQRDPGVCQSCDRDPTQGDVTLDRWVECDDDDGETPACPVVVLCRACSKKLIGPHPRLYRCLQRHEPNYPGTFAACLTCKFRQQLRCLHVRAKANGGIGVEVRYPRPSRAFVDYRGPGGRARSGIETLYSGPPTCAQREPIATADGERLTGSSE